MNNTAPAKLNVAGLSVAYWPGEKSIYIEARDSGKLVLAAYWRANGAGNVTIDEVSDEVSTAIFRAVMSATA